MAKITEEDMRNVLRMLDADKDGHVTQVCAHRQTLRRGSSSRD